MATNLQEVINLVKIENVSVIGSFSDTRLKFFSDIDFQEVLKLEDSDQVLELFQDKIQNIVNYPGVYFMDFKLGFFRGKPLKWSVDEILAGEKVINNQVIDFNQALQTPSIIKLDVIIRMDDDFVEISTNYYFSFGDGSKSFLQQSTDSVLASLFYDFQELKKSNFLKSLKRLYAYYKLLAKTSKDDSEVYDDALESLNALSKIFNSRLGSLSNQISSLETLVLIIKSDAMPLKKDILASLKKVISNLKMYPKYRFVIGWPSISKMSLSSLGEYIEEEIDRLKIIFDDDTRDFYFSSIVQEDISLHYK